MSSQKPKPELALPASIDDLDPKIADAVREISKTPHSRRATLAAILTRDGLSAKRGAAMTGYTPHSIRSAWDELAELEPARVDDESRPTLAFPTDLARSVERTLRERFDYDLARYLELEQVDENDEQERDGSESDGEDAGSETSGGPAAGTLGDLAEALGTTRSAASSTESSGVDGSGGSEGGGSGPWTGFADRPASEWDLDDLGDLDDRDVLADTVVELASDMGSRAQTERMSNLKREQVRADQAQAFALLVLALDRLRDGGG